MNARTESFSVISISLLLHLTLLSVGCTGNRIAAPSIDSRQASAEAFKSLDTNLDGKLDENELRSTPGLLDAMDNCDTDKDNHISVSELESKLERVFSGGAGIVPVRCFVMLDGKPLVGAVVQYVPEEFLQAGLPTASGKTDQQGTARPSVSPDLSSEQMKKVGGMPPGIYRIEITHPDIDLPDIYGGTSSSLGHDVDPTVRGGVSVELTLKSR